MSKAKVSEHIEVLAGSDELAQRIAEALQKRIAREFMTGADLGPKKGKKAKKGGAK